MGGDGLYIKRRDLRQIGFTQPDSAFLPFLNEIDRRVIREVDRELRMTMDEDSLERYINLLDQHDFTDPIIQTWLKQHISEVESIVVDRVNIMLYDLQVAADKSPSADRKAK